METARRHLPAQGIEELQGFQRAFPGQLDEIGGGVGGDTDTSRDFLSFCSLTDRANMLQDTPNAN
jgi:hypothetical protein